MSRGARGSRPWAWGWAAWTAVLFFSGPVEASPRARRQDRPRLLKRGPGAWANTLAEGARRAVRGVTRLLVHAVSDRSGPMYHRELRLFLEHAALSGVPLATREQRDWALASYLDVMAYSQLRGIHGGRLLMAGWAHLAPEDAGRLPLANRSLLAWERLSTAPEGGPLAATTIAAIVQQMIAHEEWEAALGTWIAEDAYLRESEWLALRGSDVFYAGGRVAIRIGVAERGESTKTPGPQGVVLDSELLGRVLCGLRSVTHPNAALFGIDAASYRRAWWRAVIALGIADLAGPPHGVRHSRPARDVLRGKRSLEAVRRRGRWLSLKSVARYTKTYRLVEHEERVPPALRERGAAILEDQEGFLRRSVAGAFRTDGFVQGVRAGVEFPRDTIVLSDSRPLRVAEAPGIVAGAEEDEEGGGGGGIGEAVATWSLARLRRLARERGLASSGTKAVVLRRLEESAGDASSGEEG